METNTIDNNKKNGIYYTPNELAEYLVKPLINRANLKIFDPAYGQGALILAAERVIREKYLRNTNNLYGCDKNPKNGFLKHLPDKNFVKSDFFSFKNKVKYDLILLNPPYVRHHLISDSQKVKYCSSIKDIIIPQNTSDLWVHFLLKSTKHLTKNGSMGAILPWSFLQADYAIAVRQYLSSSFEKIKILALGKDYFDNAEERILLLWLKGYSKTAKSINICYSKHIENKLEFSPLTNSQWNNSRVNTSNKFSYDEIIKYYEDNYSIKPFKEVAKIRIGVVTGANSFFILNYNEILKNKFDEKDISPIYTTGQEFNGLSLNGNKPQNFLLNFNKENKNKYLTYINFGIRNNIHLRAHSIRREPWYKINTLGIPDAFFHYRVSEIPFLVTNNKRLQCTNSIHRIYYNTKLNSQQKKSIQLSFFTYITQLSLEINAKIYGSGVLKTEPMALYRAAILMIDNKQLDEIYNKVNVYLKENKKEDALEFVSQFYRDVLKIPNNIMEMTKNAYFELLNRRRNRT